MTALVNQHQDLVDEAYVCGVFLSKEVIGKR